MSVQWKSAIYIYLYVCMYSFFYGTFTRASILTLTAQRTAHFTWEGEALVTPWTVLLYTHHRRKGNQLREGGYGREKPDRMSREYKKKRRSKVRGKIIARQAIILILSSSLVYSMPSYLSFITSIYHYL